MKTLKTLHQQLGSLIRTEADYEVVAEYGDLEGELNALRKEAGWVDRSARGRIVLEGPDRQTFLQALFTNDVLSVTPPAARYGAFLTNKGRMIADARVIVQAERLLLDTEPATRATVLALLDKFHFTEDLTFDDATEATVAISLFGPRAPDVFAMLFPGGLLPRDLEAREATFEGHPVVAVGNRLIGEPGCDLILPAEGAPALAERLRLFNCRPVGWNALEMARVEAGVPRFGVELTEDTIPLEAGLRDYAFSFTKGCYPGQEIIARIDARGEPARRLVGFSLEGGTVAPGTPVRDGEREAGVVLSSVMSLSLRGRPIGLGYVHKSVADDSQNLHAGERKAWIVPLPFYPPRH